MSAITGMRLTDQSLFNKYDLMFQIDYQLEGRS